MGETINPRLYFALLPIHTLALLLAISSNVSTIVIVVKTPRLHTPSCILMIVLALSDLTLSLVWNAIPLVVVDEDIRRQLPSSWVCIFIGITWQVAITFLAFMHGVVALDRYFFIVHPLKYQVHVTIKRSLMTVGGIFLTACSTLGFLLLNGNKYVYSAPAMTCVGPSYWSIIFLAVTFLPSLIVTLFSYQRIWSLCINAIQTDVMGNSRNPSPRVPAPETVSSGNLSPNSKTNETPLSRQATPTFKAKDEVFNDCKFNGNANNNMPTGRTMISVKNERKLKKIINLTTSTTIAGTSHAVFPEDSEATGTFKIGWQSEYASSVKQTTDFPMEMTTKLKTSRCPQPSDPSDSKQPDLAWSPCSLASSSHAPAPKMIIAPPSPDLAHRESWISKNEQNQEFLSSEAAFDNIVPRTLLPKSGFLASPKVIQWAAIVNPVISWMLIQEWGNPDGTTTLSKDLPRPPHLSLTLRADQSQSRMNFSYVRKRHLRACLMAMLPVLGMMACFLPLIFCLLYWEYGNDSHSDFSVIFCHLCYALAPSTVSLFLSLSNKPYRSALTRHICCSISQHS